MSRGERHNHDGHRVGRIHFAVTGIRWEGWRADWRAPALMAACTSRAAPLMSRFRSNCNVMAPSGRARSAKSFRSLRRCGRVGDSQRRRDRGGHDFRAGARAARAPMLMVGKSTCSSNGATGSCRYATAPARAIRRSEQRGAHRATNEWRRNVHVGCLTVTSQRGYQPLQVLGRAGAIFSASRPKNR